MMCIRILKVLIFVMSRIDFESIETLCLSVCVSLALFFPHHVCLSVCLSVSLDFFIQYDSTIAHSPPLYSTVLWCSVIICYTVLYYTILYFTILYYTILSCTILILILILILIEIFILYYPKIFHNFSLCNLLYFT